MEAFSRMVTRGVAEVTSASGGSRPSPATPLDSKICEDVVGIRENDCYLKKNGVFCLG